MNIRNNLKPKFQTKIRKCINLLDVQYKTLDYTLDFYSTKERLEKEQARKPDLHEKVYSQVLYGESQIAGITLGESKSIKIFLFMYDKPETNFEEFVKLIAKVYHEIRHAWQHQNQLYQNEPSMLNIDASLQEYFSLPSEKDAYAFEEQQINRHMLNICKVYGSEKGIKYTLKKSIRDIVYS